MGYFDMLFAPAKKKLKQFLADDVGAGDRTSALLPEKKCRAIITANENCVLAGAEEAAWLFSFQGCRVKQLKKDGAILRKGSKVLKLDGVNRKILSAERTSLNVLGRMSGVATICSKAAAIAGENTKVFLTRKTMPGFNEFDKKACTFGGVFPHRKNLEEMILLKENHLAFGSIQELIAKAREKKRKGEKIEVEVRTARQAVEAAKNNADIVMLDNFSMKSTGKAIRKVKEINQKAVVELSGGITLKNLHSYVKLKPEMISMGQLTKEAKTIDFSLEVVA